MIAPSRRWRWIAGALVLLVGAAIGAALILQHTPVPQVVVASTPPAPSQPPVPATKPGTLEIKTIPANATVRIDDRDAGATPIEVVVAPGRHRLHVELGGYAGVDADQDVRDGERTSATFTLVPSPAIPVPIVSVKPAVVKPHAPAAPPPVTSPVNPYDPPSTKPADPPPDSLAKPNPYAP